MSYRIISLFLLSACAWAQNAVLSSPILRADGTDETSPLTSAAFLATPRTPPAGIVPADELARTLSKKGIKLLDKAKDYVDAHKHSKAIEVLQQAAQEPSTAPFAHGLLGTEYLKIGCIDDAVSELEQAVQLLPHNAPARSNLGYALYLAGERERGEQEVRKALVLDSTNAKTRYVLNLIERGRGQ